MRKTKVVCQEAGELKLINLNTLGIVDGKLVRGYQPVLTKDGRSWFIYGRELKDVEVWQYI